MTETKMWGLLRPVDAPPVEVGDEVTMVEVTLGPAVDAGRPVAC